MQEMKEKKEEDISEYIINIDKNNVYLVLKKI